MVSLEEGRGPDCQLGSQMLDKLVMMVVTETVPEQLTQSQPELKAVTELMVGVGVYLDSRQESVQRNQPPLTSHQTRVRRLRLPPLPWGERSALEVFLALHR